MIYTAQCTLLVLHDGVILLTDNACNCEHPEQDPVKHHGHVLPIVCVGVEVVFVLDMLSNKF